MHTYAAAFVGQLKKLMFNASAIEAVGKMTERKKMHTSAPGFVEDSEKTKLIDLAYFNNWNVGN